MKYQHVIHNIKQVSKQTCIFQVISKTNISRQLTALFLTTKLIATTTKLFKTKKTQKLGKLAPVKTNITFTTFSFSLNSFLFGRYSGFGQVPKKRICGDWSRFFTGWMLFLMPNKHYQNTEGN